MNKNTKVLNSFTKYCNKHPDERFWQALKNWSGFPFVYGMDKAGNMTDTFYFDGKDK